MNSCVIKHVYCGNLPLGGYKTHKHVYVHSSGTYSKLSSSFRLPSSYLTGFLLKRVAVTVTADYEHLKGMVLKSTTDYRILPWVGGNRERQKKPHPTLIFKSKIFSLIKNTMK